MTNYLFLLISGQGLLLSFLVSFQSKIPRKNYLALYILSFTLIMFSWFIFWEELRGIINYISFSVPASFFLGPLLYDYLIPNRSFKWKYLLPTIVTALYVVIWVFVLAQFPIPEVITPYLGPFHTYTYKVGVFHSILYIILISSSRIRKGNWLFFTLPALIVSQIWYEFFSGSEWFSLELDYFIGFLVNVFFFLAAYALFIKEKKYAKTMLPKTELNEVINDIQIKMDSTKPFLRPELTLTELAVEMGIHQKKLSLVLNHGFKRTFNEFINEYRVQEAKSLFRSLEDPDTTVLEVMYKSGFNSKSTFNASFKKITGTTPLQFKKTQDFVKK